MLLLSISQSVCSLFNHSNPCFVVRCACAEGTRKKLERSYKSVSSQSLEVLGYQGAQRATLRHWWTQTELTPNRLTGGQVGEETEAEK